MSWRAVSLSFMTRTYPCPLTYLLSRNLCCRLDSGGPRLVGRSGAIARLLHEPQFADLNTDVEQAKLWCAVLGLNQLNRTALACSRRTHQRSSPAPMGVADQPGQRGELVGGDAVFEIPRA
jgi:hypothetical protein